MFTTAMTLFLLLLCLATCSSYKTYKCDTCKDFAENFNKGIEATANSNFGGGNTNWEEHNLGRYLKSETRFLEILENACSGANKDECHSMIEAYEEYLEIWWSEHFVKGNTKNLFTFFCDETLKVCCPNGTYGPKCSDCPGGRQLPCNGHGSCKGSGTRSGDGSCLCDDGYKGIDCNQCFNGYFQQFDEEGKTFCTACHPACMTTCISPSASHCEDCKPGWKHTEHQGCTDINECEEQNISCPEDKYCKNLEGSYECEKCHKACKGCIGPEKNQCTSCSARHFFKDAACVVCHPSCESSCSDESPRSCDACREGWLFDDKAEECIDKNECEDGSHNCKENQYCLNSAGSFNCHDCHSTCKTCSGGNTNQCLACINGFQLTENSSCMDINECTAKSQACTGENEVCINTIGGFQCDCIKGYVRRMGSPCFKKNTVTKKKERPGKTKRPTMEDTQIVPGPDGFNKEEIDKLGSPIEPEEEMFEIRGDEERDEL